MAGTALYDGFCDTLVWARAALKGNLVPTLARHLHAVVTIVVTSTQPLFRVHRQVKRGSGNASAVPSPRTMLLTTSPIGRCVTVSKP